MSKESREISKSVENIRACAIDVPLPFICLELELIIRSMLYLPLTSLLHPILSIPTTISRILSPSRNFLQHYFDSFSNGAQLRSFERFKREVQDGGALKTLSKAQAHLEKKGREIREAREKASEKQEEEYRKTRPEWADNLRKMKGGPGGGKGPDGASGTKEDMESKPE